MRECQHCHEIKPDEEFVNKRKCKKCKLVTDLTRRRKNSYTAGKSFAYRRDRYGAKDDGTKRCISCDKILPVSHFHTMNARYDHLCPHCKDCKREIDNTESSYISKMLSRAKQRAKKAGVPYELNIHDITIPDVCPVLGIPLVFGHSEKKTQPEDNSPSLDRIKPELGYCPGNIAVISYRANLLKSNGTVEEHRMLLEWLEEIVK